MQLLFGKIRTIAAAYRIAPLGETPFYYPHLLTLDARMKWWSPLRHFILMRADVLEPGSPPTSEGGKPHRWYLLDGRKASLVFERLDDDTLTTMYTTQMTHEQDRVQAPSRMQTMREESFRVGHRADPTR